MFRASTLVPDGWGQGEWADALLRLQKTPIYPQY